MDENFLKKMMEYPLDAQFKLNISDAAINMIIKENLTFPLISSVEAKSREGCLQILTTVGFKPLIKTTKIELEYDGFLCTERNSILSFHIRDSNIKPLLKIIGNKIPSYIILTDEYLKIDLYKALEKDSQFMVKSLLSQVQINECIFDIGTITLDISFKNKSI